MNFTPEQLKEMDGKVQEIGKFLNMDLDEEATRRRERDWNYFAELKNGTKMLSFHTSDYKLKDRWQIRAEFPRDNKGQLQTGYNDPWPEITVSMSKTPEKIARDIKSRLLPEYEAQLEKVIVRNETSNKYHAGRLAMMQKIAEFLGMPKPDDDTKSDLFPEYEKGVHRITACSEDKVKFDVEVSPEKAIEILKILGY